MCLFHEELPSLPSITQWLKVRLGNGGGEGLGWWQQPRMGDGGVPSKRDDRHYHTEYVLYKRAKVCCLYIGPSVVYLFTAD